MARDSDDRWLQQTSDKSSGRVLMQFRVQTLEESEQVSKDFA